MERCKKCGGVLARESVARGESRHVKCKSRATLRGGRRVTLYLDADTLAKLARVSKNMSEAVRELAARS